MSLRWPMTQFLFSQTRWLLPSAAGLATFALVYTALLALDRAESRRYQHEVEAKTLQQLSAVRGKAESAINKRVYLTLGLKAHVSVNPDITAQEFADIAALLVTQSEGIRSVTLIKDNVISDVYPRAGNEGALGLKLLAHPAQRDAALRAIASDRPWLAGPISLVQGGEAFIDRAPVYEVASADESRRGRYWGMVSILIDKETLIKEVTAGLPENLRIAIRGKDGLGAKGDFFLGDASLESWAPLKLDISLPTGAWQLLGVPVDGWPTAAPVSKSLRRGGALAAILAGGLVSLVVRSNSQAIRSRRHAEGVVKQLDMQDQILRETNAQLLERAGVMEESRRAALNMMFDIESAREDVQKTNRRLAIEAKEREKAERQFRLVFESTPNSLIMVDRHGKLVLANTPTETMFGYTRDELIGQSVDMLIPDRFRHEHPAKFSQFLANPESRAMGALSDLYGKRKDGGELPVEVGLNPVSIDGETFVLAAIVDISQRKAAESALQQYTDQLARSNEELEQFAYVASHDLKEPLRKVSSFCGLLAEDYGDKLDETGQEYMRYIVDGASRMRTLIQDLLQLSRVNTSTEHVVDTDMNQALTDALLNLDGTIEEARAELTYDTLPTVKADQRQMTQLLQNLIGNAIKYRGDATPKVHVGVESDDDVWTISVSDNGIGIEPQFHDKVFGIFKRLHAREEYTGTGIGLAICKKIVDRQHGKIWIEPTPGGGTTFRFRLPRISLAGNSNSITESGV